MQLQLHLLIYTLVFCEKMWQYICCHNWKIMMDLITFKYLETGINALCK